jgi:hypothetical protein
MSCSGSFFILDHWRLLRDYFHKDNEIIKLDNLTIFWLILTHLPINYSIVH